PRRSTPTKPLPVEVRPPPTGATATAAIWTTVGETRSTRSRICRLIDTSGAGAGAGADLAAMARCGAASNATAARAVRNRFTRGEYHARGNVPVDLDRFPPGRIRGPGGRGLFGIGAVLIVARLAVLEVPDEENDLPHEWNHTQQQSPAGMSGVMEPTN